MADKVNVNGCLLSNPRRRTASIGGIVARRREVSLEYEYWPDINVVMRGRINIAASADRFQNPLLMFQTPFSDTKLETYQRLYYHSAIWYSLTSLSQPNIVWKATGRTTSLRLAQPDPKETQDTAILIFSPYQKEELYASATSPRPLQK